MTENSSPTDDSTAVPAGDDWFDSWLETGTVSQRSVDVYGRPDLYAQYENLERQYAIAQAKEKNGPERDLTEMSASNQILEDMEKLYAEWTKSKTTWYIRALNEDEIDAIKDEIDFPTEPQFKSGIAEDAKKKVQAKYEREKTRADAQSNYRMVASALVKVTNQAGDVVKESITANEVEQVRSKIGDLQILRLTAAAMVASTQEPTMPVPLSPTNSNDDQDS
ncbi:hypothetical protein [Brevibacterium aurantiacum]|uniref:Uncharacterized protein n=1 Tax=Brevibacterium aurantiacum TaxID=273384 RepID=A0A556C589_BREAU|nr:hypothetical protein [Brevibacterium aurantiacum]TSI12629.1 hypothetical protein FO013_19330 [Brevibacterium aurantiacum]